MQFNKGDLVRVSASVCGYGYLEGIVTGCFSGIGYLWVRIFAEVSKNKKVWVFEKAENVSKL